MAKLVLPGRENQTEVTRGQVTTTQKREAHTLVISIAHGDLRLAKYPLAVGHYHGDTIVHAEKRLDDQLGGRLTELFNMYLYPGPVDTAEVITRPGREASRRARHWPGRRGRDYARHRPQRHQQRRLAPLPRRT